MRSLVSAGDVSHLVREVPAHPRLHPHEAISSPEQKGRLAPKGRRRLALRAMGSWGEKAFQNDAALDWLAELEGAGVARLRQALSQVANTAEGDYIDVDDGAAAIAAAEIVAAALGHGRDRVTLKVCVWLDSNQTGVVADDSVLANRAVRRVLAPSSELPSLWDEGGENGWRLDVQELLRRLGGDSVGAQQSPKTDKVRRFPARVGEREKQAIFTFLQARWREPPVSRPSTSCSRTDQSGGWCDRRSASDA